MRGLKPIISYAPKPSSPVASFTDAWIETLRKWKNPDKHLVASFTDAWIETKEWHKKDLERAVASFTDAWIETEIGIHSRRVTWSHLLQMRGLKPNGQYTVIASYDRIFYRCVD